MDQNYFPDVLEPGEPTRLATGFKFTEGPLWHPDGFWYFVDLRNNRLHRIRAGEKPELVRETEGGNGTTFDLQGNVIHCEGEGRKVTRLRPDGKRFRCFRRGHPRQAHPRGRRAAAGVNTRAHDTRDG